MRPCVNTSRSAPRAFAPDLGKTLFPIVLMTNRLDGLIRTEE